MGLARIAEDTVDKTIVAGIGLVGIDVSSAKGWSVKELNAPAVGRRYTLAAGSAQVSRITRVRVYFIEADGTSLHNSNVAA